MPKSALPTSLLCPSLVRGRQAAEEQARLAKRKSPGLVQSGDWGFSLRPRAQEHRDLVILARQACSDN